MSKVKNLNGSKSWSRISDNEKSDVGKIFAIKPGGENFTWKIHWQKIWRRKNYVNNTRWEIKEQKKNSQKNLTIESQTDKNMAKSPR